jgi:hypothetical protein
MPSGERRLARTKKLIKAYLQYHRALRKRRVQLAQARPEHVPLPQRRYSPPLPPLAPFQVPSDHEHSSTSDTGLSSSAGLLTSDFDTSSSMSFLSDRDAGDVPLDDYDSEDGWDADDEGDNELDDEGDSDLDDDGNETRQGSLGSWVLKEINEMYARRYEMPRDRLPKGPAFLRHILTIWKDLRPDHFRQELRQFELGAVFRVVFKDRSGQSVLVVYFLLSATLHSRGITPLSRE